MTGRNKKYKNGLLDDLYFIFRFTIWTDLRSVLVVVQITKTKIEKSRKKSSFGFCQVRNRKKRQNSRRILSFFPVSYLTKTKTEFFSIFFIFRFCKLYSTRTDLRVVFHHKKKYEKDDIAKYEMIPKTKYEALRLSSKLRIGGSLRSQVRVLRRVAVRFVPVRTRFLSVQKKLCLVPPNDNRCAVRYTRASQLYNIETRKVTDTIPYFTCILARPSPSSHSDLVSCYNELGEELLSSSL